MKLKLSIHRLLFPERGEKGFYTLNNRIAEPDPAPVTLPMFPAADRELHAAVAKYMPFARKVAYRYAGRGAEYEDLVQEAAMALLELIRRWLEGHPGQPLTLYLYYRLPARIRDVSGTLRRGRQYESLDDRIDAGYDAPSEDFSVFEILHGLAPEEQDMALSLAGGFTQKDLARKYHMSQQAVSKRLHKLRNHLRQAQAA